MNSAYILIQNGSVVFSNALLQSFPEIKATVAGNVIRVENVWREDLINILGDNVFWSEKQPFASFSIIFTNNEASVDTLSNLLVRYVNFHDGDYTVNIPLYIATADILRDPISAGVRPNYYGALQMYVDGVITLSELSRAIKEAYEYVLDVGLVKQIDIENAINSVSKNDIRLFLSSNATVMEIWNTIRNNSLASSKGIKSYNVDTLNVELSLSVTGGVYDITKLCASTTENVRELLNLMLPTMTSITHCLFKHLTPDDFINSKIVNITTDFGATVTIFRSGLNIPYSASISASSIKPVEKIGELVGDIFLRHSKNDVTNDFDIYINGSRLCAFYTSGSAIFVTSNQIHNILVSAKSYILSHRNIQPQKLAGTITTGIPLFNGAFTFDAVHSSNTFIEKTLLENTKEGSGNPSIINCFFDVPTIVKLTDFLFFLGNGVLTLQHRELEILDFAGHQIMNKVTKLCLKFGNYNMFLNVAKYYKAGFHNIEIGCGTSTGYIIKDGVFYSDTSSNDLADVIDDFIDVGITRFVRLVGSLVERMSIMHKNITVDDVPPMYYLISGFCTKTAGGYFASGIDKTGTGMFFLKYITVNGTPLNNKPKILSLICSNQPLKVSSDYFVRSEDIMVLQHIIDSLRDGYKRSFRYGTPTIDISINEDRFSYNILVNVFDALFAKSGGYGKISNIANGIDTLCFTAQNFTFGILTPPLDVYIGATGVITRVTSIQLMEGFLGRYLSHTTRPETIRIDPLTLRLLPTTYVATLMTNTDEITVLSYDPLGDTTTYNKNSFNLRTGVITQQSIVNGVDSLSGKGGYSISNIPKGDMVASNAITNTDMYVVYTPTANPDGSVTVSYQAFDKDGNDITSQFNTITLGDRFLHKDIL